MKILSLEQLPLRGVSHNPAIRKQVMLDNGALPHLLNFARAVFPPGEVADAHRHRDMHEVFFIDSGDGEILIDEQVHAITAGTCIVVEAGELHELRNTGSRDMVVIYFAVGMD